MKLDFEIDSLVVNNMGYFLSFVCCSCSTDGSTCHCALSFKGHDLEIGSVKGAQASEFFLRVFALSEPIWVCDIETGPKNPFFYHLTPHSERFWFFAAY